MGERIRKRRRLAARTVGLLGGVLVGAPVLAASWTVQPALDVGALRDDNIRLETGETQSTSGYVAAARLDVERLTEISRAQLNGFVAHTRYSGSEVDDKTEHGLRFDGRRQTSERGTLELDAEYRRSALFENVIVGQEGVGDVRDVDVGLSTETQVRRHYRVARPSWGWLLSERSRVEFAYRHTDVGFSDRAPASRLEDYEEDLVSGSYARQLTPRDELLVTVNAFRYRPDTDDAEAETLQLLVGRAREFSQTLRGSASIGASRTRERAEGIEETSSGVVVNARLRQEAELSRLEGVVSRDVTPSGIGRALRTDQLRVYWARQVAPTMEFVLDAQWLRSRLIEGADPAANRRYYQVSPQLRWQWLQDVSVVGSYRYRRQKYDSDADSADSSAVFLGLSYRL